MQSEEVDILGALTGLLKTLKETDKLASKPLDQWPTYAATLRKCTEQERHTVYQCQNLNSLNYSEAQSYYSSKYKEYCSNVSQCIKSRLSWSDLQLMRDIIFVLSSHGWEKLIEEEDDLAAIDRLIERFEIPLQFHAPNSAEWSNVLVLAELLFSLPASNGKLERVFSTLGTISVSHRD